VSERPSISTAVRIAALAVAVGIVAASCGSGGSSRELTPTPTSCTPAGSTVHLSAKNVAFDPTFLCAPAGQAVTISFMNGDNGVPHNVSVFSDPDEKTSIFEGDIVSGSAPVAYHVGTLEPGTYRFRCDVHPSQMQGVLLAAAS